MKLVRNVRPHFFLLPISVVMDVAFLLIIFLVLSSSFVLQPGIAVSVPFSPFTMARDANPQILTITGPPVPGVYFRERKISLEELPALLAEETTGERRLIIKADRATPYDLVVAASNHALELGYSVTLATTPQQPSLP